MASPVELARSVAGFDDDAAAHMQRLVRTWGLLSDLSLGDVLLLAPVAGDPEGRFVVLANVRASTASTLYAHDPIGDRHLPSNRPHVQEAWQTGRLTEAVVELGPHFPDGKAQILAAPFSIEGRRIGVVLRERRRLGRELLQLEKTYLSLADRLTLMIAEGRFPFLDAKEPQYGAPRVGDGIIVLDADQRVEFRSPNAVSALHRLGIHSNAIGRRLVEIGLDDSFVRTAFALQTSVTQELERGLDITITSRCLPLIRGGEIDGAFVLVRDVSELKRRDRLLLSKDTTIREIHHRVKNNLQTISSLLRLQARRVESEEGRQALLESVRRVGAIAIVHETLASDPHEDASGDDAPFVDVARPLVRLIEEGLQSPDRPLQVEIDGDAGRLPLVQSMPLAVVLVELLQNVVDHAFPAGFGGDDFDPTVRVEFSVDGDELEMRVVDNGQGPPPGFDIAEASGLGLTLVRTFVTTELGGTIEMDAGDGPDEAPGTATRVRFSRQRDERVHGPAVGT